jgi:hypothetical protein
LLFDRQGEGIPGVDLEELVAATAAPDPDPVTRHEFVFEPELRRALLAMDDHRSFFPSAFDLYPKT